MKDFIEKELGLETVSNDRSLLIDSEIDIYIPEKKIGIEYCGLYWHSEIHKDKNYHLRKLEKAEERGLNLITVFQDEFLHKPEVVKRTLAHKLNESKDETVYARNTEIVYPEYDQVKKFLINNHLQGVSNGGCLYIGLKHDGDLVSVMTFKKRNNSDVELTRFASSKKVVGGFSKLLNNAIPVLTEKKFTNIVSFADRRWSRGCVYSANGFSATKTLAPDYSFAKSDVRLHKFSLRKAPEQFPEKMSINEAASKLGYIKIWDCGKIKFEKCITK